MKLQKFRDVFPNTPEPPETKEGMIELAEKINRSKVEAYKSALLDLLRLLKQMASDLDSDGTIDGFYYQSELEDIIQSLENHETTPKDL